jgi:hypothetical protein
VCWPLRGRFGFNHVCYTAVLCQPMSFPFSHALCTGHLNLFQQSDCVASAYCLALQVQVAKGIGRPLTRLHAQPRTKASAEPFQSTLQFSAPLRAFIAPINNSLQPQLTLAVEVRFVSVSAAHCMSLLFSSYSIASLCTPSCPQALRQHRHHHHQHWRSWQPFASGILVTFSLQIAKTRAYAM